MKMVKNAEGLNEKIAVNKDGDHVVAFYKEIGERIKKAREDANLTLSKLAKNLGLTTSAVGNYETGIRQIPVHTLLECAKITGKPIHFFLGPESDTNLLIMEGVKRAIENLTEASYLKSYADFREGRFEYYGIPPMIPVPTEIAKGHDFAIRVFNDKTGIFNHYVCREFIPDYKKTSAINSGETVSAPAPIDQDDWVIAEHGDDGILEMVQFKDVTPSQIYKNNPYLINVRSVIIARLERLVK